VFLLAGRLHAESPARETGAERIVNKQYKGQRIFQRLGLTTAPLIEMLDEAAQKREPYPITWAEQAKLLTRLSAHLQDTVEFSVNTGAREENVCGLQ